MLVVDEGLGIPLRELRFQFARSAGAGGQNVNKVNTKAILRWRIMASPSLPDAVRRRFLSRYHRRVTRSGELVLSSQRFRDQGRNVADCLAKLRVMLAEVAAPPRPRRATRPGRQARERRLRNKRRLAETKRCRRRVTGADDTL
ncbi:MAG: alternative ribosome rescue aminoacyl-tRNA hydrolase ArfB [Acidobacteriota bacterium]